MQLLPGKAVFSPPKPKVDPIPPAAEPVERDDPAVTAAREDLRLSELKRKGRTATILAGNLEDEATLGRPAAGGATTNSSLG